MRTDGQEEANSRFFHNFANTPKNELERTSKEPTVVSYKVLNSIYLERGSIKLR